MAKLENLATFILSFEGGFSNHKNDKGGATNKGVTIATWRSIGYDKDGDGDIDVDDLKLLSDNDVIEKVMRPHYWNRWKADQIKDQSIANILVDWVWCSGVHGIKIPQQLLGVTADGIVGPITIKAINKANPKTLFDNIKAERESFLRRIVERDKSQGIFLKGWLRRLNSILYGKLINNK